MKRRRRPRRPAGRAVNPGWGLPSDARPSKRDGMEARRALARMAFEEGVSIPTMARVLGMGESTLYRVLDLDLPEPTVWSRALILEAGCAYLRRFEARPTSVAWNKTLARRNAELWRRWLEGWAPVSDPRSWRRWPDQRAVVEYWGGWGPFCELLRASAASYEPVAVPVHRRDAAEVSVALMHAPRTRVTNVADQLFVEVMEQLEYEWRWGRRAAQKRFGDEWADGECPTNCV